MVAGGSTVGACGRSGATFNSGGWSGCGGNSGTGVSVGRGSRFLRGSGRCGVDLRILQRRRLHRLRLGFWRGPRLRLRQRLRLYFGFRGGWRLGLGCRLCRGERAHGGIEPRLGGSDIATACLRFNKSSLRSSDFCLRRRQTIRLGDNNWPRRGILREYGGRTKQNEGKGDARQKRNPGGFFHLLGLPV